MKNDFNIKVCNGSTISSQVEGLSLLHGIDKETIYKYINTEKNTSDSYSYSKMKMSEVQVDVDKFINCIRLNKDLKSSLTNPKNFSVGSLFTTSNVHLRHIIDCKKITVPYYFCRYNHS